MEFNYWDLTESLPTALPSFPSLLKLYLPKSVLYEFENHLPLGCFIPSFSCLCPLEWQRDFSAYFLLVVNSSRLPHRNPGGWQVLLLAEQIGNPYIWRKSALPELIHLIPLFLPPLPRNLSFSAPFWLFLDVLCGVPWSQSVHYQVPSRSKCHFIMVPPH